MLQKKVKVLVLRTAGINCDAEMVAAWEKAGAETALLHVNEVIAKPEILQDYGILAIPGGFSYGDDLGAGKLMANDLIYRLREPFNRFVEAGKPILGVCNGFQVLVKVGLLGNVTLTNNKSGQFECRWVWLENVNKGNCVFTSGIERIYVPVAHGEGRLVVGGADKATALQQLENAGRSVFKYVNSDGTPVTYPNNPNGSDGELAGICNEQGTVFGLMPHPERYITEIQGPHWTREQREAAEAQAQGLKIFQNAVAFAANL